MNMSESGMVLFIPWYLLKDKKLKLADMVDLSRATGGGHGFNTWLDSQGEEGIKRSARILVLYLFRVLVLDRRYPDRVERNKARIDAAFAKYFSRQSPNDKPVSDESMRKIRNELYQRLQPIDEAVRKVETDNRRWVQISPIWWDLEESRNDPPDSDLSGSNKPVKT